CPNQDRLRSSRSLFRHGQRRDLQHDRRRRRIETLGCYLTLIPANHRGPSIRQQLCGIARRSPPSFPPLQCSCKTTRADCRQRSSTSPVLNPDTCETASEFSSITSTLPVLLAGTHNFPVE